MPSVASQHHGQHQTGVASRCGPSVLPPLPSKCFWNKSTLGRNQIKFHILCVLQTESKRERKGNHWQQRFEVLFSSFSCDGGNSVYTVLTRPYTFGKPLHVNCLNMKKKWQDCVLLLKACLWLLLTMLPTGKNLLWPRRRQWNGWINTPLFQSLLKDELLWAAADTDISPIKMKILTLCYTITDLWCHCKTILRPTFKCEKKKKKKDL